MRPDSKEEILEILQMPDDIFERDVRPAASKINEEVFGRTLGVTAMIGYSNICKNRCLYCGMRAPNNTLPRFRLPPEDVIALGREAADLGYGRIFLISGEDRGYRFEDIVKIVSALHERGMKISLACGEFEKSQYEALRDAGADTYTLKFEMSHPESFDRLNPSTDFTRRMKSIETIRSLGFRLASGNIIDWPGQTLDELADDILLMKDLGICWAPVIPYMPARNTPLAENAAPGSLSKLYREITILRLMMPEIDITAQQPGKDLTKGLSDPEANLAAVRAGANMLFFDLLPGEKAQNFRVVDDRNVTGPAHVFKVAEMGAYAIDTGKQFLK